MTEESSHQEPPKKKQDCAPPFKLTKEEKEVLRGCRNTAFLYRGLPFGAGVGAGVYWASANGYLGGLGKRWPRLLTGVSFLFAFWGGVGSYRRYCMEKLKKLENSLLADIIKMRDDSGRFFPFPQDKEFLKLMEKHQDRFEGAVAADNHSPEKPTKSNSE